jgi:phosphoribosylglycinamide formyltransferase-1
MKKIVIFASGGGSNTIKIFEHFEQKSIAEISLIVSNKASAGILTNAVVVNIPKLVINRRDFYESTQLAETLLSNEIDLIVLAGFLWKIPPYLIDAFPNKIINIHPALLPKYGGKGMYGMHVHQAVFNHKDHTSGMTIHYVNEQYDEGSIIFQATCDVSEADSAKEIARRVLVLEHQYYPQIVEQVLFGKG